MSDNAQPNSLRRELLRNTHGDTTPTRSGQRQRSARPEESTDMVPARQPMTLGEQLKAARMQQGLELSDVAGITHIRKEYLQALDEGRYNDLPETVYTRNFIRLYAQAIGVDETEMLDLYKRERDGTPEVEVAEPVAKKPKKPRQVGGRTLRFDPTSMIPMIILVVVLVGLALWGFNNFFFSPFSSATNATSGQAANTTSSAATGDGATTTVGTDIASPRGANETTGTATTPEAAPGDASAAASTTTDTAAEATTGTEAVTGEASGAADNAADSVTGSVTDNVTGSATPAATTETVPANPADSELVLFSLISSPPGATVTLDNYAFPTTTPVENAPITAGEKTLQVTLEGYQPYEATVDLSFDRNLSVALTPLSEVATSGGEESVLTSTDEVSAVVDAETGEETPVSSSGQITIQVEQDSWLEIYQSSSRGAGQTLLYRTAEAGESFSYALPVYVHVGNGAGVRISANGTDQGYVGDSGQVVGRAYTQ